MQRKRMMWIAILGGVFLLALLFISLAKPSDPSTNGTGVVIHPANSGADSLYSSTPTVAPGTTPVAVATAAPASGVASGFSLGGGQAFSLAWRLGLVVIIIAVSIVGLRWWGKKSSGPRSSTGFLRVVDTLAVGNGRTIHLVALGDRVIAIGATAQQLSFLSELTSDESSKLLESLATQPDQPIAAFASELFQSMRGNRSKSAPPQDRWRTIGDE
ncbi:MAG: flagellar biosynthetic protein FliO [Tepidiformaceae bacterium]